VVEDPEDRVVCMVLLVVLVDALLVVVLVFTLSLSTACSVSSSSSSSSSTLFNLANCIVQSILSSFRPCFGILRSDRSSRASMAFLILGGR